MNRRGKNLTLHALATVAGGLAALLAAEPIPARTSAAIEAVADARIAVGGGAEAPVIQQVTR